MRLRLQLIFFTAIRVVINTAYRITYPFLGVFARGLSVNVSVISALVAKRALAGALLLRVSVAVMPA